MNSEARRVIELTRAARTPRPEDKNRVRRALTLSLAAGAAAAPMIADAAVAAGKAVSVGAAGTAVKAAGIGAAASMKMVVSAMVVASLGAGAYVWTGIKRPASVATPAPMTAPVDPTPAEIPPTETPTDQGIALRPLPPASANRGKDPLLADLALLQRVQQAWRGGNAAQAFELAQQHVHRFPKSPLALERDALRVFTLCSLGRKAEARSLAKDLVKRAPRSPLRTSVQESCGFR